MNGIFNSGNLTVSIILGAIALVILVLSSNEAVRRLVGLADYFHLSTTFMGMTVVSLATSIPEISAHLTGSVGILRGTLDYRVGSAVVLGSNIGSDVVQQTLILGIVVFAASELRFQRYFLTKSMLPMIGTTIMCIILGLNGVYSRLDGAILFGTFVLYSYYLFSDERRFFKKKESETKNRKGVPQSRGEALKYAAIAAGAMGLTVLSAMIALQTTELLVETWHIGGSFIGVVTLGIASALPELTTALSGLRNRDNGICLGTLIGSNITNPLVAIGLGAMVSTYWVPGPLIRWDLPWETLTGAILWAILWFTKGKLNRWGAVYLMLLYCVYIGLRAVFFMVD